MEKGYRHGEKNTGWFSYDLKIDPTAEKNYLNCTYYSETTEEHSTMYVNGQKLKTVTINTAAGTNTF